MTDTEAFYISMDVGWFAFLIKEKLKKKLLDGCYIYKYGTT